MGLKSYASLGRWLSGNSRIAGTEQLTHLLDLSRAGLGSNQRPLLFELSHESCSESLERPTLPRAFLDSVDRQSQ